MASECASSRDANPHPDFATEIAVIDLVIDKSTRGVASGPSDTVHDPHILNAQHTTVRNLDAAYVARAAGAVKLDAAPSLDVSPEPRQPAPAQQFVSTELHVDSGT